MPTVKKFDTAPISFDREGAVAQKKYGGFPYALDFSLSMVSPSRCTISFINSEEGTDKHGRIVAANYNIKGTGGIEDDIRSVMCGQMSEPEKIFYCGKRFLGYPLKYSVKRSPGGDILTVDYYDASIAKLDNVLVLLAGEDLPPIDADQAEEASGWQVYEYLAANPCPEHIWILGQTYKQTVSGPPLESVGGSCQEDQNLAKDVTLYTNYDLALQMQEVGFPIDDDSLEILAPGVSKGDFTIDQADPKTTYIESYHGTLRDVLKAWGDRMGFAFYWQTDKVDGEGEPSPAMGDLILFNLKEGITYEEIEKTIKLTLNACNLLEKTESLSMEDTFNTAVSARYSKDGLFEETKTDKFVYLDFYTMPIMGCHTTLGNPEYGNTSVY